MTITWVSQTQVKKYRVILTDIRQVGQLSDRYGRKCKISGNYAYINNAWHIGFDNEEDKVKFILWMAIKIRLS